MKRFIKAVMALALGVIICTPLNAMASTLDTNKSEKEVVTKFLESLQNSDIDTAVTLSRDSTMSYIVQKNNLIDMLNNPNSKIESFEVLNDLNSINDINYLDAVVKYKNNSVEKIHFGLEKKDNNYIISKKDTTVTVLEEGITIPTPTPRTQLTSFSFNNSYDYNYSNAFSYNASYVQVNFQADGPNTFRVVRTSLFSSDVDITWASSQTATSGGTSKVVTLNCIPEQKLDNVKLRIAGNGARRSVFGEVYAY